MDSNMKLTYSKFSQKLLISSKKGKKKNTFMVVAHMALAVHVT